MGCADDCKKASHDAGVNVADNFSCKPNCDSAYIGTKDPCTCTTSGGYDDDTETCVCPRSAVEDFSKLTVPWGGNHWTLKCNDGIWKSIYSPDKFEGNNTYGCVLPDAAAVKQPGPATLPHILINDMVILTKVLGGVGLIIASIVGVVLLKRARSAETLAH